ncbi:hypothetical protein [Streptomyces sp. NPDC091268]|uniref:hypothetical protein n=1 Tax=Streptomyces sp. NPDC091268 TaxID=3365979 RepID=UPI00382F6409
MNEQESPLQGYLEAARRAYGSLEDPNFLFVTESVELNPYGGLIDRISRICKVADRTSIDADVCFYLELSNRGKWHLLLSMIGPYAMLLRVTERWPARFRSPVVEVVREPDPGIEEKVLSLLVADGFKMITAEEAESVVKFAVPPESEPEEGPLFRILFSDAFIVPWEKV